MVRVLKALDSVPMLFMIIVYTKCCSYIDGYRIGLNARQLDFATNKHTSHRSITPAYMEDKELWELS